MFYFVSLFAGEFRVVMVGEFASGQVVEDAQPVKTIEAWRVGLRERLQIIIAAQRPGHGLPVS
jgi:hypothetical protein